MESATLTLAGDLLERYFPSACVAHEVKRLAYRGKALNPRLQHYMRYETRIWAG